MPQWETGGEMGCTMSTEDGEDESADDFADIFRPPNERADHAPPTEEQLTVALTEALADVEENTVVFLGENLISFFKNKITFAKLLRKVSPDGQLQAVTLAVPADAASRRQPKMGGKKPVKTLKGLYAVAEAVHPHFKKVIESLARDVGGVEAMVPPGLKKKKRAREKADDDYGGDVALLFDIVRARLVCATGDKAIAVLRKIENHPAVVAVLKFKNRCAEPTANGFCDFMLQVLFKFTVDGETVEHVCEVQVHIKEITEYSKSSGSHEVYDFFRQYFKGADAAVRARLDDMEKIVGTDFFERGVIEYGVDSPRQVTEKLVRHVYERGDVYELYSLFDVFRAYLGEYELARVLGERMLALQIAEHGPDHTSVGQTLNNMAIVLKAQGKYDEAMAMYERALEVKTKALGPDHTGVALTSYNMSLLAKQQGDIKRARELAVDAHRIFSSALGPDHDYTQRAASQVSDLQ